MVDRKRGTGGQLGEVSDALNRADEIRELLNGTIDTLNQIEQDLDDLDITALEADVDATKTALIAVDGFHTGFSTAVVADDATDEPTAITLANAIRTSYINHLASTNVHLVADAVNTLVAPPATDTASLYALLNDLKSKYNQHIIYQPSHAAEVPVQIYAIDDLRFPAQAINPPGGGTFDPDIDENTGTILFDDNRDEFIAIIAQMPHEWAAGSLIGPHVHWIQRNAGVVYWQLEYQILPLGGGDLGTFPDWTTISTTSIVFPYTSGVVHQISAFPDIDMSGLRESTVIVMRLSRQAGTQASDTYTGDAELLEFDIHYQKDKAGTFDASPAEAGQFPLANSVTSIDAIDLESALFLVNDIKSRYNEHTASVDAVLTLP